MPRAPATVTVTEYARGFPPGTRTIMSAARATVKSIAPNAKETAYRGWPTRYFDDDGPVVAVAGYSRYAAAFFFARGSSTTRRGCSRAPARCCATSSSGPLQTHVGRPCGG